MILCCDPERQYLAHKDEIDRALSTVLDSGWYVFGREVSAFEEEFAQFVGTRHALGVGSGTDAIRIALMALDIGAGDEVITVSHTAVATATAIELAGASPVLVDIESDYFTIDADKLEAAIGPQTKAIVLVHLYGQAANLSAVQEIASRHGLKLIEDCAQVHGAKHQGQTLGSFGDLSCFSFYPTKNLGALGDGGAVLTNDDALAERVRKIREYGWSPTRESVIPGMNSRLDEIQAAILRVKLRHLSTDNTRRAAHAARYDEALANTPLITPVVRDGSTHVYHQYVIQSDDRDELQTHLKSNDVAALVHYPMAVHQMATYRDRLRGGDHLPQTEKTVERILSLPVYAELTHEEQNHVLSAIESFYATRGARNEGADPSADRTSDKDRRRAA